MINLHNKIKNLFNKDSYVDIDQSEKTALTFVTLILTIIASIMSTLNIIFMKFSSVLIASSAIATLSFILFILFINIKNINSISYKICKIFFLTGLELLMIFFFITGVPEGFGIIWSLIIPICAAFILNLKTRRLFTLIVFITIVFLFWTPIGKSLLLYDYTNSYLVRFPFAYFTFYLIGTSIEKIRTKTYHNLISLKDKYEYLAKYDSLTKLYNRQSFEEQIKNLSYPASLLMFDLDYFKVINDTYGHICGDKVLQKFSSLLKSKFLIYGNTFRWGGEEFIVLVNQTNDIKDIERLCNELLIDIQNTNFYAKDGKTFNITTSAGILHIEREKNNIELITILDKTLYSSKEKGRNCSSTTIID